MKFTVSLVLGCLYIGFLNMAASDLQHAREHEIIAAENITGGLTEHERSAYSIATASLDSPGVSAGPPVNLVECYVCSGCKEVDQGTLVKVCPVTFDPTKQNRCVTYSEQYLYLRKPHFIRGCASERGSCADIIRAHEKHSDIVKLLSCTECEGDKCNSASHSMADFTMAFLVMMVTPLIAKFTLS